MKRQGIGFRLRQDHMYPRYLRRLAEESGKRDGGNTVRVTISISAISIYVKIHWLSLKDACEIHAMWSVWAAYSQLFADGHIAISNTMSPGSNEVREHKRLEIYAVFHDGRYGLGIAIATDAGDEEPVAQDHRTLDNLILQPELGSLIGKFRKPLTAMTLSKRKGGMPACPASEYALRKNFVAGPFPEDSCILGKRKRRITSGSSCTAGISRTSRRSSAGRISA